MTDIISPTCSIVKKDERIIFNIMTTKPKLLVIMGAGASIEMGMPTVAEIGKLLHKWALKSYRLSSNSNQSLYRYLRNKITAYYGRNTNQKSKTDFEEVLYIILYLASIKGDTTFSMPIKAVINLKQLPKIIWQGKPKTPDSHILFNLCSELVDKLLDEFRSRCQNVQNNNELNFRRFQSFLEKLHQDFEVGYINLNYDNLVTQAKSNLFTGFNSSTGRFEPESVFEHTEWDFIYHLHGSVHFDMSDDSDSIHGIRWNNDLTTLFHQNSQGRNSVSTREGLQLPTSVIVTGLDKNDQIQRMPFRTYQSQVDKLVHKADAFLFIGYGFNDLHVNKCFYSVSSKETARPVVVLGYSNDNEDSLIFRYDRWSHNLFRTIPYMFSLPNVPVRQIKKNSMFDSSRNKDYPMSVWHNGFMSACDNYEKVSKELKKDNRK